MPTLSLIERATRMALQAHAAQKRKGDGSPYIAHPFVVALMLAHHGASEEVLATALVHDVVEDTPVGMDELARELGEAVARIVAVVTEDKTLPWEERKERYIEAVRRGPPEAKLVSLADKVHNLESIFTALETEGPAVWQRFTRGWSDKLELEKKTLAMFQESFDHPLVAHYAHLVERLRTAPH